MNHLTYDTVDGSGNPVTHERKESDPDKIALLVRKGWTDNGPYVPPPPSPEQVEANRKSAISSEATSRIDSATGSDLRGLILKVAKGARLSRKEAKGQANAGEVAVLDHLDALASYAEAVRTEEARLLADTNLTIEDAVWPDEP